MASDGTGEDRQPRDHLLGNEDPYQPEEPSQDSYPPSDDRAEVADRSMMPTYLGIGAVVVVLVLILVAVVISQGSDNNKTGGRPKPGTEERSGGTKPGETEPAKTARAWPDAVKGRPAAFGTRGTPPPTDAGSLTPGAYLWLDFDGWHLWIVQGPGAEKITGRIELGAEPTRAASTAADQGQVAIDGNAITFDLTNVEAPVVGVEFNTFYAGTMKVSLEGSNGLIDAGNVHIGRKETPSPNPIVLAKEG